MTGPAPAKPRGRPRKTPLTVTAEAPTDEQPVGEQPAEHAPKHAKQEEKAADERIGETVDPAYHTVAFADGSQYRCEDGKIVERVN